MLKDDVSLSFFFRDCTLWQEAGNVTCIPFSNMKIILSPFYIGVWKTTVIKKVRIVAFAGS